jgi:benzylsuccinate CoA-transferase BbsE subunit
VARQTGRHAGVVPTDAIVAPDRDGHEVHTGFPPRSEKQLRALLGWLRELGLADEFPMTSLIEIAADAGGIELAKLLDDEFTQECYRAGRDAMVFLASRLRGYDFFIGGQERALPVGVISSPEEAIADPHIVARGFPTAVHHPALGRDVVYPGAPIRFTASPWRIARPAPLVGEHQATLPTPDV